MRRRLQQAVAMGFAMVLAGCAGAATPAVIPTVDLGQSPTPAAQPSVTASAEVVPAQVAEMAFVLSAPVKEVRVKEGEKVHVGQTLIVLDAPDLAFSEVGAAAALKSAQEDLFIQSSGRRKWDGYKFVWLAGPPEQRQEARALVDQKQAALEFAQAELAQASLLAPFDGTVVSIAVRPGELVQPGRVVLVIGGLDHLRVETTDLSERLIANVHLGQAVSVRLKAFENMLPGKVSAIAPIAEKSKDGDTVYKVTVELNQQPEGLLWGMTGEADFELR